MTVPVRLEEMVSGAIEATRDAEGIFSFKRVKEVIVSELGPRFGQERLIAHLESLVRMGSIAEHHADRDGRWYRDEEWLRRAEEQALRLRKSIRDKISEHRSVITDTGSMPRSDADLTYSAEALSILARIIPEGFDKLPIGERLLLLRLADEAVVSLPPSEDSTGLAEYYAPSRERIRALGTIVSSLSPKSQDHKRQVHTFSLGLYRDLLRPLR